jgi:hypothetical protein
MCRSVCEFGNLETKRHKQLKLMVQPSAGPPIALNAVNFQIPQNQDPIYTMF